MLQSPYKFKQYTPNSMTKVLAKLLENEKNFDVLDSYSDGWTKGIQHRFPKISGKHSSLQ